MSVTHQVVVAGILGLALGGCGPLSSPMPRRLNDDDQKAADDSWNGAFTPANRLDRQTLLDAFLVYHRPQIASLLALTFLRGCDDSVLARPTARAIR